MARTFTWTGDAHAVANTALDAPAVRQPTNDETAERADNKNRRICFRDDCAWQAQKQSEDEPDKPTRPSRQLHQRHHQSDAESAKNAPSKAAVLSGNDIGNIIPTETRPKISPLKRPGRQRRHADIGATQPRNGQVVLTKLKVGNRN